MPNAFPWYWRERTHDWWQRLRRKGAVHFVIVRGVLAWGGIMFLVFFALWDVIGLRPRTLASMEKVAVLCAALGLLWGVSVWCTNEFLFRRHRELQS
jgi:hypothetical protein